MNINNKRQICYFPSLEDEIVILNEEINDLQTLQEDMLEAVCHLSTINGLSYAIMIGSFFSVNTILSAITPINWSVRFSIFPLSSAISYAFQSYMSDRFESERNKPLMEKYAKIYPGLNMQENGNLSHAERSTIINVKVSKFQTQIKYLLKDLSRRNKDYFKIKFAQQTELGSILPQDIWSLISNFSNLVTASHKIKFAKKTELGETLPEDIWNHINNYSALLTDKQRF